MFPYMPGIPLKQNNLWRFNVHFRTQLDTAVVQMVLTTCFAGDVSVEPCLS